MSDLPECHICGKPSSCFGNYNEGGGDPHYWPACDDCCGHANEDGRCYPIAREALAAHHAAPLVGDEAPRLTGDDNAIGIVMDLTSLDYVEADGLLAALDEHLRGAR